MSFDPSMENPMDPADDAPLPHPGRPDRLPPRDSGVDEETFMRYLDGELPPNERQRVEAALEGSVELQQELTLYRELRAGLTGVIPEMAGPRMVSVWEGVNRRLARPMGWVLLVLGVLGWTGYGVYVYITSPSDPVEKLATGSVAIGILLLLAGVIAERYREWLTDPYRDVQR